MESLAFYFYYQYPLLNVLASRFMKWNHHLEPVSIQQDYTEMTQSNLRKGLFCHFGGSVGLKDYHQWKKMLACNDDAPSWI